MLSSRLGCSHLQNRVAVQLLRQMRSVWYVHKLLQAMTLRYLNGTVVVMLRFAMDDVEDIESFGAAGVIDYYIA